MLFVTDTSFVSWLLYNTHVRYSTMSVNECIVVRTTLIFLRDLEALFFPSEVVRFLWTGFDM